MPSLYKKIKYHLLEMSLDKDRLESDIRNKTQMLNLHLLKCLLIQNTTRTLNHWGQEVYALLSTVPKLKSKNKYPSEKILYNCTLGYFADDLLEKLDSYIEDVNDIENANITDYNKDSLYNCIINYYKWLIPILSKDGKVTTTEVKAQINTLIKEYNKSQTHKQKVGV